MDIARPASVAKKKKMRRIAYGAAGVVAILLITLGLSRLKPAAPEVDRSTVLVDTVKRGPLLREVRGLGHLYGVEVAPGLLWSLMAEAEKRGVFLYPFTGAGQPRSEGLVVAPPLTCTDEDIHFLTAALVDAASTLG